MQALTPKLAATAAKFAYSSQEAASHTIQSITPPLLDRDFNFSGNLIKGVSGTLLERLFRHQTGFGVIGQGRAESPYAGHHLVAIRGTASGRDGITDAHFGITNGPNNKSIHAGFNHTFRTMEPALAGYFRTAPKGPVHCVGHSLGGALANLAANWLRTHYKVPVTLYTFGAPRVGLKSYANSTQSEVNNIYRCVHGADPIPMLPIWPFIHAGHDYRLDGATGINVNAHLMDGYIISAGRFCDYEQINIFSASKQLRPVRLKYTDRNMVCFSTYWQEKICNALITLLKDAGFYTAVLAQATIGTALTFYDLLAQKLEEIARISPILAEQERGLIACMLRFAGNPKTVTTSDLTYQFIRWVFKITLNKLFSSAKTAFQIGTTMAM